MGYSLKNLDDKKRHQVETALGKRSSFAASLQPIAASLGCTVAQLAIAWCAVNPNVSTVILGARTLEQLQENIGSVHVIPKLLSRPELLGEIEAVLANKPEVDQVTKSVMSRRGLHSSSL
jgi:aryl-alcohol dehydrogenase-like predicted oxidoreductase